MKRSIFAGITLLGLTGLAGAADLSVPAPVFKAAAVAPAGIWTGCYINGLMGVTGAVGVSGGPDAGASAQCLTQNGGFVYGAGIGMVFTKLEAGTGLASVSSPLTADADLTLGYAFRPMLGSFMGLQVNDVLLYVAPSLPASLINQLGTSQMDTGWMVKGGVAAAQSYTATGQVASTFGVEYRESKVDNIEGHTWMAVWKQRLTLAPSM